MRPNWKMSFENNSLWHKDMLEFVRKEATDCWPPATKELLQATNDRKLKSCLRMTFKNWSSAYRAKWKGVDDPEAGADGHNDDKKKRDDQLNRRRARKIKVRLTFSGPIPWIESAINVRKRKSAQTFAIALP